MLVKIKPRGKGEDDLWDLLLACHERIRSFIALARAVGERSDASAREVTEACLRVERYFTKALPLHVRDEEESLIPRLLGHSPELDRALLTMKEEHVAHDHRLRALLCAVSAVGDEPGVPEKRAELVAAADELRREFAEHLQLEEAVVFPAARRFLTLASQAEIMAELRRRREENVDRSAAGTADGSPGT
jgi:iron-sulfur cluster repair protein YtfE (RIC family)